ncbi:MULTISPECIES: pyridoxamine 5'-phosphate oxidase family protein [Sphingomonas]|jgi:truncated hemoglobin YjbI/predicted pyridoxine 5'-phosphate oxidase superfamily flavin-nucleotide-binding protein|uniref:globin domain-containing protein n=1 Tax=Sphingomonas TaxID=13687 RepID=UPI002FF1D80A
MNFPSEAPSRSGSVAAPSLGSDAPLAVRQDLLPGSDGEHALQIKYGSRDRALSFYAHQVLNFLSPLMRTFISQQECMFVATANRHGDCDCSSRFGEPGFITVLGDRHVLYPEYRGNGVFASLGNISENPHIGLLILDLYRESLGLHINGKARIIESDALLPLADKLPKSVLVELGKTGNRRPSRWVMVEVEEAFIQCSKNIPLVRKLDRTVDPGTDSVQVKKSDYFQLHQLSWYERIGGDATITAIVDVYYRNILADSFVASLFQAPDTEAQRLRLKSFVSMAFGGPHRSTRQDLLQAGDRLASGMVFTEPHFDRVVEILKQTLESLLVHEEAIRQAMAAVEATRHDILAHGI